MSPKHSNKQDLLPENRTQQGLWSNPITKKCFNCKKLYTLYFITRFHHSSLIEVHAGGRHGLKVKGAGSGAQCLPGLILWTSMGKWMNSSFPSFPLHPWKTVLLVTYNSLSQWRSRGHSYRPRRSEMRARRSKGLSVACEVWFCTSPRPPRSGFY